MCDVYIIVRRLYQTNTNFLESSEMQSVSNQEENSASDVQHNWYRWMFASSKLGIIGF